MIFSIGTLSKWDSVKALKGYIYWVRISKRVIDKLFIKSISRSVLESVYLNFDLAKLFLIVIKRSRWYGYKNNQRMEKWQKLPRFDNAVGFSAGGVGCLTQRLAQK
jgi:hypothetical protein